MEYDIIKWNHSFATMVACELHWPWAWIMGMIRWLILWCSDMQICYNETTHLKAYLDLCFSFFNNTNIEIDVEVFYNAKLLGLVEFEIGRTTRTNSE